jgi:hypothetical protein
MYDIMDFYDIIIVQGMGKLCIIHDITVFCDDINHYIFFCYNVMLNIVISYMISFMILTIV